MTINIIVAATINGIIGNDNELIWHYPEDLKHFKNMTTGKTVVMGWNTFESLGRKPLPNRRNIVISRHCTDPSVEVYKELYFPDDGEEIFVIGGSMIYGEYLPYTDKIYFTLINQYMEGNKYFFHPSNSFKMSSYKKGDHPDLSFYEFSRIIK